jgi:hypothetical protein
VLVSSDLGWHVERLGSSPTSASTGSTSTTWAGAGRFIDAFAAEVLPQLGALTTERRDR